MKSKAKKSPKKSFLRQVAPYFVSFALFVGLLFVGTLNKTAGSASLNIGNIVSNGLTVSTDQVSEFYIVANLSNSLNFASVDTVSGNYVAMAAIYDAGQTSIDKLEKPYTADTSKLSRGIILYTVQKGDTMKSIAKARGLTTDQIRWSNGLKTETISVDQKLYLPSVAGIVYKVKSGDTIASISRTYGATTQNIISYNDLETDSTLVVGSRIVLPGGTLPVTERPEYVAPTRSYTYSGSAYARKNVRVISRHFYDKNYPYPTDPGVPGQCTWYAWWWRATNPASLGKLPGGLLHARQWASQLASRGVSHTPKVGAVFQTSAGYYGHVGVVTAINADGSITVREMNYLGTYIVSEAEIPANIVRNFNYIY